MLASKLHAVQTGLAVAAQGPWPSSVFQKGSGMGRMGGGGAVGEWYPSAPNQEAGD